MCKPVTVFHGLNYHEFTRLISWLFTGTVAVPTLQTVIASYQAPVTVLG